MNPTGEALDTGAPGFGRHQRVVSLVLQFTSFVLVLGVPDGILGVLWPTIRRDLHLTLADLGPLVLCGTVLYVLGGLFSDRVRALIDLGNTMLWVCLLAVASLAIWAGAPDWTLLLLGIGVLGLSKGMLDAVVNAEAALDGGMRRLGLVHAGWAVGGTLGPLLVAVVLATSGNWRVAVAATGTGCAFVVLPLAILDRRRESALDRLARADHPTYQASHRPAPSTSSPAHRHRLLAATALAFAAYAAAETGPIAWGYTYLTGDRRMAHGAAAVGVAAYWAALMVGRFALAAAGDRAGGTRLLTASCLLLVAGTAMLWLLPGATSVAGLPVAGLGAATFFPVLVALTPGWMGAERTGRTVGLAIASAAIGGPVAVTVLGVVAEHLGLGSLAPSMFVTAVLLLAVNLGLTKFAPGAVAIVAARQATPRQRC